MLRPDKRIKAVIFDLDDTLIDWSQAEIDWASFNTPKYDNIRRYLIQEGFEGVPELDEFADTLLAMNREVWIEAKPTWHGASFIESLRRGFEQMGLPVEEVDFKRVLRVYDWTCVPGVRPFPDTHEVLTEIKRLGYQIGLITNSYQPMWFRDIELEAYELLRYLDARITSGDTGFMKPHPAIYWRMLGLLDRMPDESIFVGDRPKNDILGAINVGMRSVLMSPPHLDYDLEGIEPTYTIGRLTDLLPILRQLD